MARDVTLDMAGGVHVVLPDGLNYITTYVLFEQQDWFEDELGFLRRWLQPGQRIIDVGANYGVYTLSLAKQVGSAGAVWAFEPSSRTASYLNRSIEANAFSHVTLDTRALSNASGTAHLTVNDNSELNNLVRDGATTAATETVAVSTLDESLRRYHWQDIDFVKIDAEGEESNIIEGGQEFLSQCSPLIMYEVKEGHILHLDLVKKFAGRGYDSFRLIPGLDVLIPFDADDSPDGYLLNLFCCKSDRAHSLAQQGVLVDTDAAVQAATAFRAFFESHQARYAPRQSLSATVYGAALNDRWDVPVDVDAQDVHRALTCYAMSRDKTLKSATRYVALQTSFDLLQPVCERAPSPSRMSSLARISRDYGARSVTVSSLQWILETLSRRPEIDTHEPFLAPGVRFDTVDPRGDLDRWFFAAALEQFERVSSFSSFFTNDSALRRLETLASFGYDDADMKRRLQLLRMRFPQT